jgi:hypothetical protein
MTSTAVVRPDENNKFVTQKESIEERGGKRKEEWRESKR